FLFVIWSEYMTSTESAAAKPQLITPTFVLAWVANFCQFLVFYLSVTTMALYAVESFGASDTVGGFASSAFVLGATCMRVFSGWLVDRVGHKKAALTSLVFVTVVAVAYFFAQNVAVLIIVRFLHGTGYALTSTALMAVAQSVIPHERRAEGTGYFALGTTLATAFGPALGLFLANNIGYNTLFAVALGANVVSLVLALVLRYPAEVSAEKPAFTLRNAVHPNVVPIGLFMLLVGIAYSGVVTYLNAYARKEDLVTGAGLFFIGYAVTMLIMRFVLGRIQDHKGDNAVMYLGLASFIIALLLMGFPTNDVMLVVAGACTGLGFGTLSPACQAISVRSVPAAQMGAGISTMFLLMDLGIGLAPFGLGPIVGATGFDTMYLILAALVVIAAIYYFFVHGRFPKAKGHHLHFDEGK
ncbi:MAG: MFS transporter, partial [Staphylococcus warneri]|nr:MFS transporter [Staphylococcus warneri]